MQEYLFALLQHFAELPSSHKFQIYHAIQVQGFLLLFLGNQNGFGNPSLGLIFLDQFLLSSPLACLRIILSIYIYP